MKVYLAARFSRQHEIRKYARDLGPMGIDVTSRWLKGSHGWVGTPDHEIPELEQARFAREDLEDINAADIVICFTEEAGSGAARGGRHVEMGYALAKGKRLVAVGPAENIFYSMPIVARYPDWESARQDIPRMDEIMKVRAVTA